MTSLLEGNLCGLRRVLGGLLHFPKHVLELGDDELGLFNLFVRHESVLDSCQVCVHFFVCTQSAKSQSIQGLDHQWDVCYGLTHFFA